MAKSPRATAVAATAAAPQADARAKKLNGNGRRARYRCRDTRYTAKLACRPISARMPLVLALRRQNRQQSEGSV